MTASRTPVDLPALRRKLAQETGPRFWRSLEELAETPAFLELLQQEFPPFAAAAVQGFDRRRFLQLMAASMALGGLTGCQKEVEQRQLSPYVEQPPGIVPGLSRHYATATSLDGFGYGVILRHEMGRPLKVEGNPDHPASLGGSSAIGQASILGLYDPYRAQTITQNGQLASDSALRTMLVERAAALGATHGSGLRLLTGAVTSPSLAAQIDALRKAYPQMAWHQWEAVDRDTVRDGARLAFGRVIDTVCDFARADLVLGIESDALSAAPGHLRYARDFAARRRPDDAKSPMSRLYAIESTPTLLGAKADHRLVMKPGNIQHALRLVAGAVKAGPSDWANIPVPQAQELAGLIADLQAHRGRCLVHAGRAQPADIHALCHAINHALDGFGQTVHTIEPVEALPTDGDTSLAELVADIEAGRVDTLFILGVNAAYTAPADIGIAAALRLVPHSIYLGERADETAELCHWHIPAAHEYEMWSDVRAYDGTATIQQPQVRPLYGGRSAHEILAMLLGEARRDDRTALRERWRHASGAADFERFWTEALRAGVVPNSAAAPTRVAPRPDYATALPPPAATAGLSLLYRPDLGLWDGRFADNGWLQEMARPFTRLTWDNAAEIAPATAERLGLQQSDMVELALDGKKLRAPVWILPGQAAECVTLRLGYGRRRAGPVGTGVGVNAYRLRSARNGWNAPGLALAKVSGRHLFASEQHEWLMHGENLIRATTLEQLHGKSPVPEAGTSDASLYPGFAYDGIAWAMSISLNSCIGCQACVIACQAENNIPVVGKEEVARGRIMHWLRIDRYYEGPLDAPATHFQPVPCMHCENAPCEVVCPVQATVHDSQGLNVMVYNRCVGTRFCSNNCPYKVRRFNFFDYSGDDPRPRESWNPEVTVRGRGVMEKCTYCIQRTRQAMIEADKANRPIADGEVLTACQQACPTQAIVFGNKNDTASAVARRKASALDYAMLDELNTRPRTSYETAVRNPNPSIKTS